MTIGCSHAPQKAERGAPLARLSARRHGSAEGDFIWRYAVLSNLVLKYQIR